MTKHMRFKAVVLE